MTTVDEIANTTNFSDEASVQSALIKLKTVPNHELHYHLVLRDTLQSTAAPTRKAITMAQVEFQRRTDESTRSLAFRTTLLSGAIGLLGVVIGAFLGAWFAAHFGASNLPPGSG